MSKACLVDTTKCIGCRACQVACKQWNGLEAEKTEFFAKSGGYQNPPALSSKTFSLLRFTETAGADGKLKWVFARQGCMHCEEPSCASACLVGALQKTSEGSVIYDGSKCIGCRYCMVACPFGVPTCEWDKAVPYIKKCTFCFNRHSGASVATSVNDEPVSPESQARHREGAQMPACGKACPTGCLKVGQRNELLAEARQRMAAEPARYVDHIYGEKEAGGTSWLFMASVPFAQLGFPMNLGERSYPSYTRTAMGSIGPVVTSLGVLLPIIYWVANRKTEAARSAQEESDQA